MQKQTKLTFILILSIICLNINQNKAQTILLDPYELYIGASGGATGSMVFFNPIINQTYLLGVNGGISMRYITEKHFGLQLEINYSERGWAEADNNYSRQLSYIEMPFLTHLYTGKKNRFIFNLGPKVSYLIKDNILINNHNNPTADQHILPINSKFDYGIAAGFGYNLKLPRSGVYQFELRAFYGLGDIMPNQQSDYFHNSNHINVSANIAYFFQLKGKESKESIAFQRNLKREVKAAKLQKKELAKENKKLRKEKKKKKKTDKAIETLDDINNIETEGELKEIEIPTNRIE